MSTGPFLWPLMAPVLILVISLHLIDGYGALADRLSLDYASMHLIASFFAALTTLLLTFVFIPAGFEPQTSRAAIVFSFAILSACPHARVPSDHPPVLGGDAGVRNLVFVGSVEDFCGFHERMRPDGRRPAAAACRPLERRLQTFESVLDAISRSELQVEAIVVKESGKVLPSEVPMKLVQLYFDGVPTYTLEIFHEIYWRKIPLYRINPTGNLPGGFHDRGADPGVSSG